MVQLGKVATIDRQTIDPSELEPDTAYLGLEHIERGGRILRRSSIGESELTSGKFRFSADHVLFGKLRPNLGKVARPSFAGVCSTDILPIRPTANLDRDFLLHFLRQPVLVELAASKSTGANLPRLNPSILAAFMIPLPPLADQRRIATILDKADALRTKQQQELACFDILTQSIFTDMFGDFEISATAGDFLKVQGGLQVTSKRNTLPIEVPYLRVANSFRSRLHLDEVKTLRATANEIARTRLEPGDLLFVEGHGNPLEVGRVSMWEGQLTTCVHQNHLIRGRVKPGLLPQFAMAWFNSRAGAGYFQRAGRTTSGLNTISASTVKSAPLPVPPIERQREFVDAVARIKDQSKRCNQRASELGMLFASLQARAFRGEL